MATTAYANRKNATKELNDIRALHRAAVYTLDSATKAFYRSMANTIRSAANGKENAKPASYFANLMSDDSNEQHAIASTIGVCGAIADDDFWATRNGHEDTISRGYTNLFLYGLRRTVEMKAVRWAEVDESGKAVGKIHKRMVEVYSYYWVE